MSIYSVNWHFFKIFDMFCPFGRNWCIPSTKYHHNRDQQVNFSRNRHLTCLVSKKNFWRPFWFFSKTRFSIFPEVTDRFCWFSIANIGRQLCTLCSILKKIKAKLRPWECRNEKGTKWPSWRHPFWIFIIREKCHWQISSRSFVESFIKIDISVWAVEMTHTRAQTDTQTHKYPRSVRL